MIKKLFLLQLLHGSFTIKMASKFTGKSYPSCAIWFKRMEKEGVIKKVRKRSFIGKGGRNSLSGSTDAEYALTENGRQRIKVGLTGGSFDILHPGHIDLLRHAKKMCDVLVVVVASDETILKSKRHRPFFNQDERARMVEAIRYVDLVIKGRSRAGISWVLEKVRPDIVILGRDQIRLEHLVRRVIEEEGMDMEVVKLDVWKEGMASSIIREKMFANQKF